MVINKGLERADGLGTVTVGGKKAIKHKREKLTKRRNQIEFLFETLKETVKELSRKKLKDM